MAITSTRCPCATKAISPSRQWLAELISLLQQLSGGLSATRFRSMRAWAQIVGPLLHPRSRCAALATHTRRVELCMCHMWPLHAMKTPIRHRGMCEWDSEASHWHLAAGAHTLAAAVPGGTHNLVAAFLRGQQAPARCCVFPWGSHHLAAADAYGTRKLAVAPCWWQSQA